MIKINLSTTRKKEGGFGGFDLSKLKIQFVLVAIIAIYIPDFTLLPMWQTSREEANTELANLQTEVNSLKRKAAQGIDFEKQIRDLKAQEESLGQKLTAVKQAISEKRNPAPLLLYISKNVPDDLWITELNIDKDLMTIKGEALDYTNIGNFVNNMRSSVFIKDAQIKSTSSRVRESDKRRLESFEVNFFIARFEQ